MTASGFSRQKPFAVSPKEVNLMSLQTAVRLPLRALLLPIRITIFIFTGVTSFILNNVIFNRIFSIVSDLLFLGFLALTWSAVFVQHDMPLITRILIPSVALLASYIASPVSGVLKYMRLLMERIRDFNDRLKEI
jgi:hypothetical protein